MGTFWENLKMFKNKTKGIYIGEDINIFKQLIHVYYILDYKKPGGAPNYFTGKFMRTPCTLYYHISF